jgi:hypothetical protein
LSIVIVHPCLMDLECLLPTRSNGELGIGHSANDIEMGLNVVLPWLSLLDVLLHTWLVRAGSPSVEVAARTR